MKLVLTDSYVRTLLPILQSPTILRATFSGPHRMQRNSPLRRVVLRALELHNTPHIQISRFDDRKDITENAVPADLAAALEDVLAVGFSNVHIDTVDEEIDLRLTKRLKVQVSRRKRIGPVAAAELHNRRKHVPLPEGAADHLLQVMGIMTQEGRIRAAMRGKFTQINEFLKLLDPLLDPLVGQIAREGPGIAIPGLGGPLRILDCGSGSAYLTFAAHHYLNHVRKIPAVLMGVDVNDELIQKSIGKARHLDAGDTLAFAAGRIGNLTDIRPDIVLALHACDTATDDAIAQGVHSGAKIILAVPCCHKHLNASLDIPALKPLHRHGILHQRFADIVTDAFRALILRIMGYRTDVIEFISPEYTAKNLMIRAIQTSPRGDAGFVKEYLALKTITGATPYLESAIGFAFTRLLVTV